ncbi:MAG: hypothetical protein RI884_1521 [Pseudomonadota bacterium]|jgi:uncharacterized iron-regulated protein
MRRMARPLTPRLSTLTPRLTPRFSALLLAAALTGCASLPPAARDALPADALLLGEQHDAPAHQRLHHQTVSALASRGQLGALALEMVEQGSSTQGLARDADEATVRRALGWNEQAWPWAPYGPTVMAAVRAGVPVLGANLPRARMRAAMGENSLDQRLPPAALERQREAIRAGHCGLLPETQIAPMARIQVARDVAMADTVSQAARAATPTGSAGAGRTVVLVAGSAHVDLALGVPQHLPGGLRVQTVTWPAAPPARDYCADLRRQMQDRQTQAPAKP